MKKYIVTLLVTIIVLNLLGCCNYAREDGEGLFALIETDSSRTLTTGAEYHYYYYLKDTGIVYVGYISNIGNTNNMYIAPVISENGNYYVYDTEKKEVVELIKEYNNLK